MKNIFYTLTFIVAVATTLSFGACKKSEIYSLSVPANGIIVSKPGDSGTTTFDSSNITSITATSIPKGWVVDNINMYEGTITVTSPSTFTNNEEYSGTLTLNGYSPTGNTKTISIHLSIVESVVDYTATPANCYIASKPDTRYMFNPMIKGDNTPIETSKVEIIWQTNEDLIQYLDMRDGVASFYIGATKNNDSEDIVLISGNALIGAYDEANNLLWSWHIWVTNNDPTASENIIYIGGVEMMNINLGADGNSNGSTNKKDIFNSYGLYYQWGRKEPFVGPESYNFSLNEDHSMTNQSGRTARIKYVESTSSEGTMQWANENPLSIIKGNKENNYDWIYSGHESQWSEENNPCPAGWRVPDASVFENLTIAPSYDEMAWEELQPLYGIMLTDTATNEEHFFTAQGRRNYLDCRLDIINDDEVCPVPWSGYYWSASTNGNDASAMFFDLNTATRTWNGCDTKHAMHRANALPVRCVKE